jgi:hypothetical protein
MLQKAVATGQNTRLWHFTPVFALLQTLQGSDDLTFLLLLY